MATLCSVEEIQLLRNLLAESLFKDYLLVKTSAIIEIMFLCVCVCGFSIN